MKRLLRILLIVFVVLIAAAIAVPFLFKDKIIAKAKTEINKNVNAKVNFGDFHLSILSSFPNLTFTINDVSVVGINEFEGDTLTFMKSLSLKLNIWDVIGGGQINIQSIHLEKPYINIIVLQDGKANYDIAKSDSVASTSEPSSFKLALESYSIDDGRIYYNDKSIGFNMMLDGVNHKGKGDFTQDLFTLSTNTEAEKANVWYGGVKYLSSARTKLDADLEMDMKNAKYTFKENELSLNELVLGFDGWLAMPANDINMDLKFNVKKNDFRNFVSMIPGVYRDGFKDLKSGGKLAMNGFVKGTYNETKMPGFGLNLKVDKGMFQYPSLPTAVNNVNIDLNVNNPDGVTDHTVINLKTLHAELGSEPFDARLYVTTPVSDANIDAFVKGSVNLANIKNIVPLDKGTDLNGMLKADLTMKGRYSAIEKQQYDQFNAAGNISITGMNYQSPGYPATLISNLLLTFNPKNVTLNDLTMKAGRSDIKANGSIDNLLGYYLKDELLKGGFTLNSNLLDLNEFMTSGTTTSTVPDTSSMSVIELPANVDLTLTTAVGKVLYDNLVMDNLKGTVALSKQVLDMRNLTFNMLSGAVNMNGKYATPNPTKPDFTYNLKLTNLDIQQTAKAFNTVKRLAPVAERANGRFSCDLSVDGKLNQHMQPQYTSLNGSGKLTTQSVTISNFEPLNKIAAAVHMDQYKQLPVENVDVSFAIVNGKVMVKPFETTLLGAKATIQGVNGLDQSIDYTVKFEIPKNKLSSQAQSAFSSALGKVNSATGTSLQLPDPLKVNVLVGGTALKPTVTTDLKNQGKNVVETVKEEVKEEIKEQVQDVKKQAKEQADKIMADAQKQAQQIRDAAKAGADKAKKEGYAAADKLVAEAKNPVAKIAAQKAADKMKKETDAKAQKIIDEGNAGAQKVLDEAQKKSDALLK